MQNATTKKRVEGFTAVPKDPDLPESQDYDLLRRKAILYIEQMGSKHWTDYNTHDPGITILEALCYGLTDLGYRAGWNISDLLAENADKPQAEKQGFFTPREILVTAPLTINDYRRLLLDLDTVINAWIIPLDSQATDRSIVGIQPKGIYSVVLELEKSPEFGDLNERKSVQNITVKLHNGNQAFISAEFRFPEWDATLWGDVSDYCQAGNLKGSIANVTFTASLWRDGTTVVLTQEEKARRWKQWNNEFFGKLSITFSNADGKKRKINIADIPFRLSGSDAARDEFISSWLTSNDQNWVELAGLFIRKTSLVEECLAEVTTLLDNNRNMCEIFSCPSLLTIEDIGVCADIDLAATADIELVLAEIIFRIERYFRPPVPFRTLDELMEEGLSIEEIFDGPPLRHGFIKETDLEKSGIKQRLRTSDIINELMNIDGIDAVRNLQMTRYDNDGSPNLTSEEWSLKIGAGCQPGLACEKSRFVFFKNGLPFLARASEVQATLSHLRERDKHGKTSATIPRILDLPVPCGYFRSPGSYWPVQYALPMTYGTRPEGLREPASEKRKAQAMQLKAYLMVFEQILANCFAQLSNMANLFKLDDTQTKSYFACNIADRKLIAQADAVAEEAIDTSLLEGFLESEEQGISRRKRFLDHLLARFGETFSDQPLMMTDIEGKQLHVKNQLQSLISFLSRYPVLSRDRARSFNYRAPGKIAGDAIQMQQPVIREKIAILLGMKSDSANDNQNDIIVVEHLLLRPGFVGDAHMEACTPDICTTEPYSFRMTIVMPGWKEPYCSNMELRRFADRTIEGQLPSHLIGKICWISNIGYGEDIRDGLIDKLFFLLREKGRNAGGAKPSAKQARKGAENIHRAAQRHFAAWVENLATLSVLPAKRLQTLRKLISLKLVDIGVIYPGVKNYDEIGPEIHSMLIDHFMTVLDNNNWYLHDRFAKAWKAWLEARNGLDACDGAVTKQVKLWLQELPAASQNTETARCIITLFGEAFSKKMRQNVFEGTRFPRYGNRLKKEITEIFNTVFPNNEITGIGIGSKQKTGLLSIFVQSYQGLIDICMKHWEVLLILRKLHNIYPVATLHDCDQKGAKNPVRLNSTALGNAGTVTPYTSD